MKAFCKRIASYPFERRVQAVLASSDLPGVFTNNVIIPNVRFRWLPNELDFLLIVAGILYVIDAKDLAPGFYRDPPEGKWEYSADGVVYRPAPMTHPRDIAFSKARVLESYVRDRIKKRNGSNSRYLPNIVSAIVVPDHADVSGMGWCRQTGRDESDARLLLAKLHDLPTMLAQDSADFASKSPRVEDLCDLLSVTMANEASSLPCWLTEQLEVVEELPGDSVQFERTAYRGYYDLAGMRSPVRIELIPKRVSPALGKDAYDLKETALRTCFRSNERIRHPNMLAVKNIIDRPNDFLVVSEYFSPSTLQQVIESERFDWGKVKIVFRPIADLLRHAHEQGVIHRYLDPASILVIDGVQPQVRVHGFYGALVADCSRIPTTGVEGNPYVGPECDTATEPDAARWLDVYSLGRCIIASLTGDPMGTVYSPLIPAEAVQCLESMTAMDPRSRSVGWARLPSLLASS